MMELTVPAALEELEHVQEFVEQALEEQYPTVTVTCNHERD